MIGSEFGDEFRCELRKNIFPVKEHIQALEEERDALRAEWTTLRLELMQSDQKRRTLSQSLSDLGGRLEGVETSWTPWKDLKDAKQHVGEIQNAVGEIEPDHMRGA